MSDVMTMCIDAVNKIVAENAEEITELDQAIGDGDHVSNLQRGLQALNLQKAELAQLDPQAALQKIGMTLMSKIGGASGSLYGTLFVAMAKSLPEKVLGRQAFALAFSKGVEAVKMRGKAERGEKTMLDTLIPVAELLSDNNSQIMTLGDLLKQVKKVAEVGAEGTRGMVATKGRASFLGERSIGHVDAGARSSQLMICAIADALAV